MKEPVRERINATLNENKLSVAAFSKEVGIGQTTLNRQLNGDARVSVDTIKAFLHRFKDVSAEWLLRGVGDMCCGVPDEQLKHEIAEETGRVQRIGDNSSHNTQTMTENNDVVIGMLRDQLAEKNEEIKFLRSLIAEMNQNK